MIPTARPATLIAVNNLARQSCRSMIRRFGICRTLFYSVLRLLIGLLTAAFIDWKLTVNNVIRIAARPAEINTHPLIGSRYAKSSSHFDIAHHAIGTAMRSEIKTNNKNSRDNRLNTDVTLAPNTFLIPISFVR